VGIYPGVTCRERKIEVATLPLDPQHPNGCRLQAIMVREHPHHFVREAARRERQARAYLLLTAAMILVITVAFLWWTW
jgi:hypothetical protein